MTLPLFVLSVIFGMMLAEARISRRHEALLRARGGYAPEGDVYRVMSIAYPVSFLAMGLEGVIRRVPLEGIFVSGALLLVASKVLKYWAIGALRERWSFRVWILPGAPLVTHGPYRYIDHPNYLAVVGELFATAMMMRAVWSGPIAVGVFGVILWARLRFETAVLRKAYER